MLEVRTFWTVSHKKHGGTNSTLAPGLSCSLVELARPGDIYQEDQGDIGSEKEGSHRLKYFIFPYFSSWISQNIKQTDFLHKWPGFIKDRILIWNIHDPQLSSISLGWGNEVNLLHISAKKLIIKIQIIVLRFINSNQIFLKKHSSRKNVSLIRYLGYWSSIWNTYFIQQQDTK